MRVKAFVPAVLIGFLLALSGLAQAVEVKNLYKTVVEVPDRSNSSLRRGEQEALAEIVIRVSGDSRALEAYDIIQAMDSPDRYIEQFSFDRQVRVNPETGLPEPAIYLNVAFNPRGINQLVRRAGLPIWASNRAEVLLWLVVEDEKGRRLVNSDSAPDLVEALKQQAHRRGLPVAFPINDLEDQLAVSTGDVWGMFMDPIVAASGRYGPGAILVGKVYRQSSDGVRGAWAYRMDNSQEFFETREPQVEGTLASAIDFAANQLAAKYAVVMGEGDTDYVWLDVEGVENLTDFARLTEYLDKLVAVKQANMDRLQENGTRFRVYLESDVENLRQLLKLDKKLIELETVTSPMAVKLSVNSQQQAAVTGNAVVTDADAANMGDETSQDQPALPEERPAVELRYHWYRTYVPEGSVR